MRSFRAAEASDFLSGTLDGVSIGPLGKLRLASALDKVATVQEPFLLSAARDSDGGWVIGTGNSGKVFRVTAEGEATELFATEEPEVFAVWVEDQTVYAAGSPGARIYRQQPGSPVEVIFDTQEQYIWAVGRENGSAGRLLIATGVNGKLIALDEDSGESEVVYDSSDAHLRTMLVRESDVLVGTVGEGRILSLSAKTGGESGWVARTLYDAAQPEITSLTSGPDGSFFAAAVASEASLAQLPAANADAAKTAPPAGTRPASFEGARSVVLEVSADGSVDTRGTFDKETVYSVLWQAGSVAGSGELWIATGQDGKLYRSRGKEVVLERDLDELQLIQLLTGPAAEGEPGRLSIATTNGAALYQTSDRQRDRGEFRSKVLDAKFPSRFGTLHYEAAIPAGTRIAFAARSGLSAFPDDTWSAWVGLGAGGAAGSRRGVDAIPDLDLSSVPRGRYLQWRAVMTADSQDRADGFELSVVELSYAQENRAPEITKLEVMAPGVILVNGSFNPSNQVFEPASPNRDGIFTSLDKPAEDSSRPKELWKLGYRTVRWEATDPNKDDLRYSVAVRAENQSRWYGIAGDVSKTSWGFDSTVLPDGLYRVRLRASDHEDNGAGEGRTAERISGVVVIDHSSPEVKVSRERGARSATVQITDALSPLRKIELSRDAAEWRELRPADGMVDSRRETIAVDLGAAAGDGASTDSAPLVLLRVQDAAFNTTVVQLELP